MKVQTASDFFTYYGIQYSVEIQKLVWDEMTIEVQISDPSKVGVFTRDHFQKEVLLGCPRPVVEFPLRFTLQNTQYEAQVYFKTGDILKGYICLKIQKMECYHALVPGERLFFHVANWPEYGRPEEKQSADVPGIPDQSIFTAYGREWIIRQAYQSSECDLLRPSDLCHGKAPFRGGKGFLMETIAQENDSYDQLRQQATCLLHLESLSTGSILEWKSVFAYREGMYIRVEATSYRDRYEQPRIHIVGIKPGDIIRSSMESFEGDEAFWGCATHYFLTSLRRPTDAGIALLVEFPLLELLADKCYLTIAEAFTGKKYGKMVTEDDKKQSMKDLDAIIGKKQSVMADSGDVFGSLIDMWRNPDKKNGGASYKNKISSLFRLAGYTHWEEPQASDDLDKRNALAHNLVYSFSHTREAFDLFYRITFKTYLLMMAMLGSDGAIDFHLERHKVSELMPDFRTLSLSTLRKTALEYREKFNAQHCMKS